MRAPGAAAAALIALAGTSCAKVPIYDVDAGFTLADVAWFAEEETLFVFYEVNADQGLGEPSVIRSEERRVGKECRSRWSPYH